MSTHEIEIIGNPEHPDALGYVPSNLRESKKMWLIEAIQDHAKAKPLLLGEEGSISREDDIKGRELATVVARGNLLAEDVPWLEEFYRGTVRAMVSELMHREAVPLDDLGEGIMGNVLGHHMRFESHVDQWPLNANLYLKMQKGGWLILGTPTDRTFNEVIEHQVAAIAPIPGTFSIAAAQNIPHTVEANDLPHGGFFVGENKLKRVYEKEVFKIPDISEDAFWELARISVNFGFSTAEFNEQIRLGNVGQAGVAGRTYGTAN